MDNSNKNLNSIFEQSMLFRSILLLSVFLYMVYVSIEIYKSHISEPFIVNAELTQVEFNQLHLLSNYAFIAEVGFLILLIVCNLLMFKKEKKPFFKDFILFQLLMFTGLFLLNTALAWLFNVPIGNMTQILFAPFTVVMMVLIYFLIESFLRRREVKESKLK
ncbi:hypothetical protein [Halalkalibacter okhensis]|uniref:Uncharacterized protein n=1 Tax=Halalkalibacter okhensis TaxID=333138 RepID=A0A0B0ID62_9BACI|nr:hypothetical protein [Halalkalibacter okhensis]KHF39235.1 hypothetical protein LQ50_16125 [Halalkalibacter okhensis]